MKSIPNKIIDSLSYSLPIISTLKGEVSNLINKEDCGISIENDYSSWKNAFERIINYEEIQKRYKKNCINAFIKNFDFEKIYNKFVINSEKIINSQNKSKDEK